MTMNVLEDVPLCQKAENDEIFPSFPDEGDEDPFAVSVPFVVLLAEIRRLIPNRNLWARSMTPLSVGARPSSVPIPNRPPARSTSNAESPRTSLDASRASKSSS